MAAALIKDAPSWQSKSLSALQLEVPVDLSIAATISGEMVTPVAPLRLPLAEAVVPDLEASQASALPSRALTWQVGSRLDPHPFSPICSLPYILSL